MILSALIHYQTPAHPFFHKIFYKDTIYQHNHDKRKAKRFSVHFRLDPSWLVLQSRKVPYHLMLQRQSITKKLFQVFHSTKLNVSVDEVDILG
ncbi:hypothetical protein CHCC20335_1757 [Bacillus paralicheniformis]|nr:hypothetical protein CHCC20335_1757 [Bacillus paralicheniformis]